MFHRPGLSDRSGFCGGGLEVLVGLSYGSGFAGVGGGGCGGDGGISEISGKEADPARGALVKAWGYAVADDSLLVWWTARQLCKRSLLCVEEERVPMLTHLIQTLQRDEGHP
ncbi:hypothetical protein D5086_032705 [Populus alba]|uniref:Uncharacterized protein n=1 Tax=Populus alba TaxID=43335 RepID=A0ACC4AES5_POPAL